MLIHVWIQRRQFWCSMEESIETMAEWDWDAAVTRDILYKWFWPWFGGEIGPDCWESYSSYETYAWHSVMLCTMIACKHYTFYYFIFFLVFIFTLFYFTILYWFCHTLTWIHHGCTWVPKHEPPSHLPPHIISLDHWFKMYNVEQVSQHYTF